MKFNEKTLIFLHQVRVLEGPSKVDNSSIFLPSGQACFDQAKAFREVVDIGSVETLDEVASR